LTGTADTRPLHPAPDYAQQDTRFSRAFDILREGISRRAFPGAALAVTYQRRLVALKALGRFTYESDSPAVQPDTIYDLASVTKVAATTTMAMLLYERGLLDLDAPLVSVLPSFKSPEVTFRMLLAHSSGLPAYVKLFEQAHTRDALVAAALATPLEATPDTRTAYSDIGFILLGAALEKLAGESPDTFSTREIFGPLTMTATGFCPPRAQRNAMPPTHDASDFRRRIVQGEVNDENASVMGGAAGHAGLFAPAADVARFAECMLSGGRPILRPETVALFTKRQDSPPGTSRALGWDTPSQPSQSGKYFSPRSFGHLGYTGTSLWIDPERRLSVTLLTNRTWPDRSSQPIKEVRPRFHDAVVEALEARP
jgi:serine-type D-Ala-D-Ala carboxypeptidase